ncbi:hypothetical protein [Salinispora vitiensis]|uniref:hypothetical protein n=1 Tax=Salinispora vitiensis TaxID=999544 RepID=UPI0009B78844|nr:hypothetical protein [Salinispora vitiensis]
MMTKTTVEQSASGPVGAVTDEQLIAMLVDRARDDGLKQGAHPPSYCKLRIFLISACIITRSEI